MVVVGKCLVSGGIVVIEFIGYSFLNKKWVVFEVIVIDIGEDFVVCFYGYDIYIIGGIVNMFICLWYLVKFL